MTDAVMADQEAGEAAPKKRSSMRLILFIVLPILLLAGIAAGLYFGGVFSSAKKDDAAAASGEAAGGESSAAAKAAAVATFYDLPDMLVNLNTGGRKTSFLKMTVSLQLDKADDQPKVQAVLPRIVDTFQTYLRELRPEDLRGSAGLYRLREELLMRVNALTAPIKVDDVLFREMLVQ